MKQAIKSLAGNEVGEVTLDPAVFGLEPRTDILHRCVTWQRAKKQAGTHKTQSRSEVSVTGKKMVRQKGSGGARHGARTATLFRGGQKAHGPVVRSHAHQLPKKLRALALRHALSAKMAAGELMIVKDFNLKDGRTKNASDALDKLGVKNGLLIDEKTAMQEFSQAVRNISQIDMLPAEGLNVYDILRRHHLLLSEKALEAINARFEGKKDASGGDEKAVAKKNKAEAKPSSSKKEAVEKPAAKKAKNAKSTSEQKKPVAKKAAVKKPAPKKTESKEAK